MTHKSLTGILILSIFFTLPACTSIAPAPTEEQPNLDLFELSTQADEAYQNDDYIAAEQHYEKLVKEIPEEAEHWFRLANIYVKTDRPFVAMNLYREAVIRKPDFAKAWYNLGIVQLKQTAFSLNEMLIYTDINDPLHTKAATMLEEIKSIINE